MPICMRMCAIRLDEACDMNMDTGAGTATRDASQTCGEWGQGRRDKEEGERERGKASIADKQRNVCNVLWQLIMRATGFLICATALWQVKGEGKVKVDTT